MAKAYREVEERDEHRCRFCFVWGDMEHHHLRPRSRAPELRTAVANILLLCGRHHQDVTDKKLTIIGLDANGPLEFRSVR